ncbi:unnamed protein product, partial [Polarella glacialis]
ALRSTLAAAVQRSSAAANVATAGSDPSVGKVYCNSQHAPFPPAPHPQQSFALSSGMASGGYGPAPGHATQVPQPGMGQGRLAPEHVDRAEQDREIDRLRRELRKAEEKSNFFRNQVITLQQQVASMGAPIMAANAVAAMPQEILLLREELQSERLQREAMQQHLQTAGLPDAASVANVLQERGTAAAGCQGRARNCETIVSNAEPGKRKRTLGVCSFDVLFFGK